MNWPEVTSSKEGISHPYLEWLNPNPPSIHPLEHPKALRVSLYKASSIPASKPWEGDKKTPFINSRKETKGFQGTGTNIRSCGTKCPKNLDRWFFEATTQKDNERTRRSREFFETAGKNHIFLYRWSWNTLIQEQSLLIIQAYCNYIFASTCIVTCCPYPLKIYVYYEDSLKNGSTLMIFSDSGLYLALKLHHIERIGFNWEFFEVVALLIDATWWSF